ncbi:MAG TPA: ATP-binding protein, partial [Blastocatellia bacterium]
MQDSGLIKFTPLTVLIGYNGSGKSSLIEGLELIQTIGTTDVDEAVGDWQGFEHIWHKGVPHEPIRQRDGRVVLTNPMSLQFDGSALDAARPRSVSATIELTLGESGQLVVCDEEIVFGRWWSYRRDSSGLVIAKRPPKEVAAARMGNDPVFRRRPNAKGVLSNLDRLSEDETLIKHILHDVVWGWQFVALAPNGMGGSSPLKRTGARILFDEDGSNLAEYLLEIKNQDEAAFRDIFETLRYVLPYAVDLEPAISEELEQSVYLRFSEQGFNIPGWVMSQGTLRLLGLLALLRHPSPPTLLVIEEIENGLDPRVIHLIVEEMLQATGSGRTQIIVTTHS